MFANGEVPIVAGHGAEHFGALSPGRPVPEAKAQGRIHKLVHQGEARVAPRHHLGRRRIKHSAAEGPKLGNAQGASVVPRVVAILIEELAAKNPVERVGGVELACRGLASGEIKGEGAGAGGAMGGFRFFTTFPS